MKIKDYHCDSCGSNNFNHIGFDKYICTYCGTVVERINDNIVRLEVCHKNVERFNVLQIITAEALHHYDRETIEKVVRRNIARQITDELLNSNCLRIEKEVSPERCEEWYRGYIEVVR